MRSRVVLERNFINLPPFALPLFACVLRLDAWHALTSGPAFLPGVWALSKGAQRPWINVLWPYETCLCRLVMNKSRRSMHSEAASQLFNVFRHLLDPWNRRNKLAILDQNRNMVKAEMSWENSSRVRTRGSRAFQPALACFLFGFGVAIQSVYMGIAQFWRRVKGYWCFVCRLPRVGLDNSRVA